MTGGTKTLSLLEHSRRNGTLDINTVEEYINFNQPQQPMYTITHASHTKLLMPKVVYSI